MAGGGLRAAQRSLQVDQEGSGGLVLGPPLLLPGRVQLNLLLQEAQQKHAAELEQVLRCAQETEQPLIVIAGVDD